MCRSPEAEVGTYWVECTTFVFISKDPWGPKIEPPAFFILLMLSMCQVPS